LKIPFCRGKRHPFLLGFSVFTVLCLLLLLLFRLFPAFAEWFARVPASFFRLFLGAISSVFPFSLFEVSIGLFVSYLVFLLFFSLVQMVKKARGKETNRRLGALFLAVLIVLLSVVDLFALTFAASYHRTPLARHLSLDTDAVSQEDLFYALEEISRIINESAFQLEKNEKGESLSPDLDQIQSAVRLAANAFGEKHSFYQKRGFPAKKFLSSPWMTYTHISGIYGFFTGEAGINTNYPHFVVTASLAHEISHARGIAPENECNVLAGVILIESSDPYLRYCGAVALADDFISQCRKLDKERTNEILKNTDPVYARDMAAYSRFFDPYRDSALADAADLANDSYLKSQGQKEGVVSYSRILRLTAAYFRQARENLPVS